ncbi:MAG: glycosyltransferase family 2 protein [Prevotella sp.]|nr:glycosyltransferase family 2 protein [Prevotella sp.]
MSNINLSVVVPAYNAVHTLRRCVESIVRQSVGIEVIIVDDGSTDSTGALAETLKTEHPDIIKVIHQANGGLSAARNSGIEASSGELITFVDSDDMLKADIYPAMTERIMNCEECDFIEFSVVRSDGQTETSPLVLANATYRDSRDYWLHGKAYNHAYACNKMFRRRVFFNNNKEKSLRFEAGRAFEDVAFLAALLAREPVVITADTVGYIYSRNPAGITARAGRKEWGDFLDAHLAMFRRLNIGTGRMSEEEEEYYMTVVNIQIMLYRAGERQLSLPSYKVNIRRRDLLRPVVLIKKIVLNVSGISGVCRAFGYIRTLERPHIHHYFICRGRHYKEY